MQTAVNSNPKKSKKPLGKLSFKTKYTYREYPEWYKEYPKIGKLEFRISLGSYFDERVQISSHLTTMVAVIGFSCMPLFPLWSILLWLIFLLIPYGKFYLNLPIYSEHSDSDYPEFGFYFYSETPFQIESLWICRGWKKTVFYMPWSWDWVRTSALRKDGTWEHEFKGGGSKHFWDDKWKDVLYVETFPYKYVLKCGVVQHRTATIRVEEREWRWRKFKRLPWPNKINTTISVDFNEEVGERTGSWKGGTVGCSYSMRHGELPEQTLRRMERERKF